MSNAIMPTTEGDLLTVQEGPGTINKFPWRIAFGVAIVASVAIGIYRGYQQT